MPSSHITALHGQEVQTYFRFLFYLDISVQNFIEITDIIVDILSQNI
jgi:hypothetical protein